MTCFNEMTLTPEIKQALDWGLLRMYVLGPLVYYGIYRALKWLADRTIAKYSEDDDLVQ